ncbi:MAG: signal peptidase I [Anaerolineaceae bacterium]|nr:signal peptidase I [Anaerolineaceae bacterium]MCB9098349.1 signal peptidase I [Anaerolineales bacterium]
MALHQTGPLKPCQPNLPTQDSLTENGPILPLGLVLLRFAKEVVSIVVFATVIALALNFFIMQVTYVHGKSMEPNLHSEQRLMIEKVTYQFSTPQRGDIVVIHIDSSPLPLIKRVVGLPGEEIKIRDNHVFIDGQVLNEPYLDNIVQDNYGPIKITPAHIFVLGDNRGVSHDSRFFGPVQIDNILGRAWLSYWPLEDLGPVE